MEHMEMNPKEGEAVGAPQDAMKTGAWAHDLCGCFDNLGVCVIAYIAPCVTFGQTHEKLWGEGCGLYGFLSLLPIVGCVVEAKQRREIRERRGIEGNICKDFMTVSCCHLCSLVQAEQEALAMQTQQAQQGTTIVITQGGPAAQGQYPEDQQAMARA